MTNRGSEENALIVRHGVPDLRGFHTPIIHVHDDLMEIYNISDFRHGAPARLIVRHWLPDLRVGSACLFYESISGYRNYARAASLSTF